jgi:hypothetical protein
MKIPPMVEHGTGRQPAWKLTAHSEHQPRELTVPTYFPQLALWKNAHFNVVLINKGIDDGKVA